MEQRHSNMPPKNKLLVERPSGSGSGCLLPAEMLRTGHHPFEVRIFLADRSGVVWFLQLPLCSAQGFLLLPLLLTELPLMLFQGGLTHGSLSQRPRS